MKRPFSWCCSFLMMVVIGFPQANYAQVSDNERTEALKNRVLDQLFPVASGSLPGPYYARLILRFSSPDTELVLVIYAGWKSELVGYTLDGLPDQTLSQYIREQRRTHPQIQEEEIARSIRVKTTRSFVDSQKVKQAVEELRRIRVSPFLETRIAVDEYSDYDYWFESGGESVHYRVHGIFQQTPADDLVHWMIGFRDSIK
jgi:hypothetical protein